MNKKTYIAIDLKSFYASVECIERGLDPLDTNLVVADESQTDKTICLAVSPSMKEYGIPGRPRLFEVKQSITLANNARKIKMSARKLKNESFFASELKKDPRLSISFIVAPPKMKLYMKYSKRIYEIYLRYFSADDIHVYSIDEVFIDATNYLSLYNLDPMELTQRVIGDILTETGITATAGIGTNLYIAKVAMDIMAKHVPADENGARIAFLDEKLYREKLWAHKPITDFWRVGRGYKKKLDSVGLYTMGDIARCSLGIKEEYYNEALLYKLFGINAELLIDHAWGDEPCTIKDIKSYKPETNSISSGQVLSCAYNFQMARVVVMEMAETISLELVKKDLVTNQLTLTVGYDIENFQNPVICEKYDGEITVDQYGRMIPKHYHKSGNFDMHTSSSFQIVKKVLEIYDKSPTPYLLIRRLTLTANHIMTRSSALQYEQLTIFDVMEKEEKEKDNQRETKLQNAMIQIKTKYGENAVVKGTNMRDGATGMQRNNQIGGHHA